MPSRFTRFQSPTPDEHDVHVGVFGLLNSLGRRGVLSPEQETWRRDSNAWYDAAYTDPSTVDPSVYDRAVNPGATAWFKIGPADWLIDRVPAYLALLELHDESCVQVFSDDPGTIVYEDEHQVVAVPVRRQPSASSAAVSARSTQNSLPSGSARTTQVTSGP